MGISVWSWIIIGFIVIIFVLAFLLIRGSLNIPEDKKSQLTIGTIAFSIAIGFLSIFFAINPELIKKWQKKTIKSTS